MDMIAHQAITVKLERVFLLEPLKNMQIAFKVLRFSENILTVIAPLNNVVD